MPSYQFICEHGELLPRWRAAFPSATAWRHDEMESVSLAADLVWLHLRERQPAAQQITVVRRIFGDSVKVIVLSSLPHDEEAIAMLAFGAKGYCNAHASPAILQHVAETVLQGGLWIGESLMRRLREGKGEIG